MRLVNDLVSGVCLMFMQVWVSIIYRTTLGLEWGRCWGEGWGLTDTESYIRRRVTGRVIFTAGYWKMNSNCSNSRIRCHDQEGASLTHSSFRITPRLLPSTEGYDAEYKFVSLIWDNEPINSTELVRLCQQKLGWKKSTTYTVLRKLCARGVLRNEEASVVALVKREDVQQYESAALIDRSFGGSLPTFLTAFLGKKKLSPQEAEALKRIIEEAAE